MAKIEVKDDAHWHELRHKHIGGTEASSLFGVNPWLTAFEVFHRKKGNIPEPDLSDNDKVFWGKYLEPSVAAGAAEKYNWEIRKVTEYNIDDSCPGLGASLDYEIINHPRGMGILEIKTVDWLAFQHWADESPPLQYELQLQTQFATTNYLWGVIAVLIGGNDLRVFEYDARPKTIAKIRGAVTEFWERIRTDRPYEPDFTADAKTITQLFQSTGGGWTNLTGNDHAEELCKKYLEQSRIATDADKLKEAYKAELLTLIGNADKATVGGYNISSSTVEEKEISYTRKAYRNVRITEKKAK